MDDDATSDLIVQLCTRIGMIMEDANLVALTIGGLDREGRAAAIAVLEKASADIAALTAAARVLSGPET
ncbi:hypothetical protein H7F51_15765 [Novosphingobium flavum]|uniref:Uncharacterized protein n=1 Tax=Novosphingobium flavum TaxID=1778672 RepID=A0A7X1KN44_9SPHN|nr:hypothetical protein [Novosphingobium flavum]MBC2666975.1 hypothetical protein [Novosphingobium flavum]